MNLLEVINNLYTKSNINWLKGVGELNEIQPFILNKWLSMNKDIQKEVKYLNKYVFHLTPLQFILLAHSVIPKYSRAPFCKYIKNKKEIENEYNFLIKKIRKYLEISDNDWNKVSDYYINNIEKNKIQYFKEFGIEKKLWKKFGLDYKEIKKIKEKNNTLNKWF